MTTVPTYEQAEAYARAHGLFADDIEIPSMRRVIQLREGTSRGSVRDAALLVAAARMHSRCRTSDEFNTVRTAERAAALLRKSP